MSGERLRTTARGVARLTLRFRPVSDAVRAIASARGRGLVLVYHRVVAAAPSATAIVPAVPAVLFRRHVEALRTVGDLVPLEAMADGVGRHARPRFAVTFDDDYATHVDEALPILRSLEVPATFFLSGRALRSLGPYWFEVLEDQIEARSLAAVARELGVDGTGPDAVAVACERDRSLQARLESDKAHGSGLDRRGIEALVAAGMGVGFHTLRHHVLFSLPYDELEAELTDGRDELEAVVGRRVGLFAYPHGKADRRIAAMVRRAGYVAAFTGRPSPVVPGEDRYLLGRWEPGPVDVDDLLVESAIRLNRRGPR